jgi:hypothetical protein
MLRNPAYLGYAVWGRTRHGQPGPERYWACSYHASHSALVDPELFWAAYDRTHIARSRPLGETPSDADATEGHAA